MRINDNPTASGSGLGAGPTGAGGDKSMPKDGRVMMAILKDMNITDYEPRVVEQLLEFTYRYISSVLEDARTLANFAKKKGPPGAAGSSGGGNQVWSLTQIRTLIFLIKEVHSASSITFTGLNVH